MSATDEHIESNAESQDRNTAATDRNTASQDASPVLLSKILMALKFVVAALVLVVVFGVAGFLYVNDQEDERQQRTCQVIHDSFDAHTSALIAASGEPVDQAKVDTFNKNVHDGIDAACR